MTQYILKSALVGELEKRIKTNKECMLGLRNLDYYQGKVDALNDTISSLNTLEVKDPYEQCVQYPSVNDGIQAHAETYSFNIESLLFNQLTKEQQKLWRKEIEQACISGGEAGVELARDIRYKENLEVKEVDLENYNKVKKVLSISFMNFLDDNRTENKMCLSNGECFDIEKAFDELDFAKLFRYMEKYLKAQKGE